MGAGTDKEQEQPSVPPAAPKTRGKWDDEETELTPEDLQLLDREGIAGALELDPRTLIPGWTYRWVHKSRGKVDRAKLMGYRIVDPRGEEGKRLRTIAGDPIEPHTDNTITVSDVVLMKVKKKLHALRQAKKERRTASRLEAPKKGFIKKAKRAGVKVNTDEKED